MSGRVQGGIGLAESDRSIRQDELAEKMETIRGAGLSQAGSGSACQQGGPLLLLLLCGGKLRAGGAWVTRPSRAHSHPPSPPAVDGALQAARMKSATARRPASAKRSATAPRTSSHAASPAATLFISQSASSICCCFSAGGARRGGVEARSQHSAGMAPDALLIRPTREGAPGPCCCMAHHEPRQAENTGERGAGAGRRGPPGRARWGGGTHTADPGSSPAGAGLAHQS